MPVCDFVAFFIFKHHGRDGITVIYVVVLIIKVSVWFDSVWDENRTNIINSISTFYESTRSN